MKLLSKIVNILWISSLMAVIGCVILPENFVFAGNNTYILDIATDNISSTDNENIQVGDTNNLASPMGVADYQELEKTYPYDLNDPNNAKTTIEYDEVTGNYIMRTMIGDMEVTTPFVMSGEEYKAYSLRRDMADYWNNRNSEAMKS